MAGHRRPESVLVVVYTQDRQALLLKRKAPFEFWQSVTGSLDPDESPLEAARRELAEETSLPADNLADPGNTRTFTIDPRWLNRYAEGVTENREYEFRLELATSCDVVIDTAEHSEWRWVPLEEAVDLVWSWTNKEALQALIDS